ncbi:hypothetical protein O9H85_27605 [Paenibacillus filicis]|uniref:Cytochrome P450 n=1 Tax=Paenibacillus gyeongsangnamensis TaxID=3388067 RepID=A0ABT4QGW4_9BACL|nr:hypothetical protein [Paenibacillus filicis]MCZ8516101.1 hypothetical protein [Paenibacillus filicis]
MYRSQNRHLAFAAGIHFCLGYLAPLARMEGQIAVQHLVGGVRRLHVSAAEAAEWYSLSSFRGLERLPVRP